ncbi:MAG: MFS transporter, partial [Duganella sp.]
ALAGPPLGAALAGFGGARAPLLLMAACAALALLDVLLRLPETRPAALPLAPRDASWMRDWRLLLRDRTFIAYTALTAASYTGHYLFLALSPFALIGERGLTALDYGYVLSASSAVHLGANFVCRRWLKHAGIRATLRRAGAATLAGGVALALLQWAGVHSAWAIIAPQWLYMFGHAMHQSCGQAAVSAPFPQCAGTAASLSGFVLVLVAVVAGELMKWNLAAGAQALAYGMGLCAVATAAVAWCWVQRHGEIEFTGKGATGNRAKGKNTV